MSGAFCAIQVEPWILFTLIFQGDFFIFMEGFL